MSTAPIRTLIAVDNAVDQKVLEAAISDPGIEVIGVLDNHGEMARRTDANVDAMLVAYERPWPK